MAPVYSCPAISKRQEDRFEVTNLTIADAHNYAVGNGSLLVHNTSICSDTISETKGFISSGSKTVQEAKDEFYAAALEKGVKKSEIDKAWDKSWGDVAKSSGRSKLAGTLGTHDYPVDAAAHHILPVSFFNTELGKKFHGWGIDLNGANNGVWLPRTDYDLREASLHTGSHLASYGDEVLSVLSRATDRQSAIDLIDSLRQRLLKGTLPLQNADL